MKRSHGMFIDRKEGKVETNAPKRQERFLEKQHESCTASTAFTQIGLIKTRDQRCNLKEQKKAARRLMTARPVSPHHEPRHAITAQVSPHKSLLPNPKGFTIAAKKPAKIQAQVDHLMKENATHVECIVALRKRVGQLEMQLKSRSSDVFEDKMKTLEVEVERLKQFDASHLIQKLESLEAEVEIQKFQRIVLESLAKQNLELKLKLRAVNWWENTLCHRPATTTDQTARHGRTSRANRQPPARYLD